LVAAYEQTATRCFGKDRIVMCFLDCKFRVWHKSDCPQFGKRTLARPNRNGANAQVAALRVGNDPVQTAGAAHGRRQLLQLRDHHLLKPGALRGVQGPFLAC
jgi:hypothetical protein